MKKYDVIVIGGGPSGMMAALSAQRVGASVALVEKNERLGKKILATGNGKCNLTNEVMDADCFYSSDKFLLTKVLGEFGKEDLLSYCKELGMLTCQKNGYYYPRSQQAQTVRDAFESAIMNQKIVLYCQTVIENLSQDNSGYTITTNSGTIFGKRLIVCTGGLASPKSGSNGDFLPVLEGLGVNYTTFTPALVPLCAEENYCKKLAGIRTDARITLMVDGKLIAEESGEIQLTDYGISGIPTFQLSRIAVLAVRNGKKVQVFADFLTDLSKEEIIVYLTNRLSYLKTCQKDGSLGDLLSGIGNYKLLGVIAESCRLRFSDSVDRISNKDLERVAATLKRFPFTINGDRGFEQAQVSAGGISLQDLNEDMSYKANPNLYFAGEICDVDGICGGYNLQWAFSSGYVAGRSAGSI